MKRKLSFLLFFASCLCITAYAQKTVEGRVTNATTGQPINDVSVNVVGTNTAVFTDANGKFSIKVSSLQKAKLGFSFVGFKSHFEEVQGRAMIDVKLQAVDSVMEDVVVIGYGVQRKSHLTGSIAKLKNDNLDEIPTSSLDKALQGKLAGVNVQNTTSETGVSSRVRVRGLSSLSAGSDPLYVVDGQPVPDGLASINTFDVESIEVLKDAASAAIYGSRAANGVIIITTKSGKADKPKYNLKAYTGVKSAYKLNPLMTFTDYVNKLYKEAGMRQSDTTVPAANKNLITAQERAAYIIESAIDGGVATNWQDAALQDANIYNVQLGISGGKKDLKYYISGNYQKDNGIMLYNSYDKVNFRAKVDGTLSKTVKFGFNFNPSYSYNTRPAANFTDYYRFYSYMPVKHNAATAAFVNQNPQWASIRPGDWAQPRHFNNGYYFGTMPDGSYWDSRTDPSLAAAGGQVTPWSSTNNSPASIAASEDRSTQYYRMIGGGDITVTISKNLIFKTFGSVNYYSQENNTFTRRNARTDNTTNSAVNYNKQYIDLLWENTLNYIKKAGGHNFTGLLGYSAQKTVFKENQITAYDLPSDDIKSINQATTIDHGSPDNPNTYANRTTPIGLLSAFGRLTYDYKGKYLASASLRTDGSSRFAEGRKWGWFPSASVGWLMSNEDFMKNITWLNNLKVRASWGATGNNNINDFAYMQLLYGGAYSYGSGTGSVSSGQAPTGSIKGNPDITWERTFEYNFGIDMGLFNNRVTIGLEYYTATTDKLLLAQPSMAIGGPDQYWNNAGKVGNKGFEVELSTVNVRSKKLEWNTSFNIAFNKNKVLSLGGSPYINTYGERNEIYTAIVGQPSIQFFGYKTDGVWKSQAEIDAAKAKGQTSALAAYYQPGGLKFVDVNGDGVIDINDRTVLGSPFPKFTWGITNTIKYKGFDLTFLIQGVQGGKLYNGDGYYQETRRINKNYNTDNRWVSAANPGDGKTPYNTNGEDWMLTDYVIENASYAALRNMVLGYSFPKKIFSKLKLNGLRAYVSGENLCYIMPKSYRGINPEARATTDVYKSPLIDGYQRGAFPIARTFTFGLDLNF
ncbi:MAG: TonB-dependent receptor [Filimonas sp.]|nr:TonB-dependent receptor [Filimonas sp.]